MRYYISSKLEVLVLQSKDLVSYRSKETIAIATTFLDPEAFLGKLSFELGQVNLLFPVLNFVTFIGPNTTITVFIFLFFFHFLDFLVTSDLIFVL